MLTLVVAPLVAGVLGVLGVVGAGVVVELGDDELLLLHAEPASARTAARMPNALRTCIKSPLRNIVRCCFRKCVAAVDCRLELTFAAFGARFVSKNPGDYALRKPVEIMDVNDFERTCGRRRTLPSVFDRTTDAVESNRD